MQGDNCSRGSLKSQGTKTRHPSQSTKGQDGFKARAFGADPIRRLIQDIMMSATKNDAQKQITDKIENRLVENNRITRKPNVNRL